MTHNDPTRRLTAGQVEELCRGRITSRAMGNRLRAVALVDVDATGRPYLRWGDGERRPALALAMVAGSAHGVTPWQVKAAADAADTPAAIRKRMLVERSAR